MSLDQLLIVSTLLLFTCTICASSNHGNKQSETKVVNGGTNNGRSESSKPHIIFIFADDLGHNDLSYIGKHHRSALRSPNIDNLAAEGIILENYYVQPICTPTRSQLMSGRYQIHTGLYHSNIHPTQPACLPLDEVTLAQKMKESGYATHMVGKWHLGFYKKECLPTYRGFDTYLGYYTGSEDYFSHIKSYGAVTGYDFHRDVGDDLKPALEYSGQYSTLVFTQEAQTILKKHKSGDKPIFLYLPYQAVHGPLEVPDKYKEPFKDIITASHRLNLAGMVSCLDEGIANLTQTLKDTGLYNNTIIIFSTDNGGPVQNQASNWPLRGSKGTLWEGGVHGVGFIHSPLLPKHIQGTTSKAFIHVTDWFPTIVESLAGGTLNGTKPLDGFNVWESITEGTPSPRTELLHNIDPYFNGDSEHLQAPLRHVSVGPFNETIQAALRVGDWKILTGIPGDRNYWYPPVESGLMVPIEPVFPPAGKNKWLFNITADPYEMYDVADKYPSVVKMMLQKLDEYYQTIVPVVYPDPDPNCDPAKRGGVWGPWE